MSQTHSGSEPAAQLVVPRLTQYMPVGLPWLWLTIVRCALSVLGPKSCIPPAFTRALFAVTITSLMLSVTRSA